jgi:hydrogenase-4 component B
MSAVFAAGFIALAVAVVLPLIHVRLSLLVSAAGAVLLAMAGFASAGGWTHVDLDLGSWLGFGHSALVCDGLSGIFFALVGGTGAAVSLALLEHPPSGLASALHSLILLAVATVVGANQGFLFLLAWETITLSLFLLASAGRERPGSLDAAFLGGGLSKLGGAAILAAFALLYGKTRSFDFTAWAHQAASLGDVRSVVFVLLLIGFGSKIGVLPLQGGLPPLYEASPGATGATMAVAFNAGLYGMWRLMFGMLGPGPLWWGEVVIVLGGLGALVGIIYAVSQEAIPRFLGFSSVENGGIILLGFGVALLGHASHKPDLAAAGLLAATLQLVMHGMAKVLAFVSASRVEVATGERDLGPLGGLGVLMPRTGIAFGVAVLTLAAMPPLGGFVSEWFTFEALLQGFRLSSTISQLVMALGAAILALTAGIGLLAFAKLYGGIFLGAQRKPAPYKEPSGLGVGVAVLTLALLALGPVAPWEIRWLGRGLSGLLGFNLAETTIKFPLVLGPVYRNFSVLSPTWLALGIPTFIIAAAVLVRIVLRPAVRRAPVWVSGTAADIATVQYTPDAYANPIRVVLAGLYGFRRFASSPGPPKTITTMVVPAFETYIYRPVAATVLWLSGHARRLQSGRLSVYLLYVLVVLLVILALIPALKD